MDSQKISNIIEKEKERFEAVSDKIWEFAEIRYQEFQSSELLCTELENHGFRVCRKIGGIPTAFMGEYGNGKPVIAFLGEFDALPGLSQKADEVKQEPLEAGACGHGCGHHLLGAGSLEAACAVKKLMEEKGLSGMVRYYGCPAEEGGAGKAFMVRAGANPHMGRSALDALEFTNVGCNYLREHIIPEARIHYAVTDTGGTAPNVVQAYAEEIYCIRAPQLDQLENLYERVCKVAKGAAMMTETNVTVHMKSAYANLLPNKTLHDLALKKFHDLCPLEYLQGELEYAKQYQTEPQDTAVHMNVQDTTVTFGGSTDVGDVSWNVPTLSISVAAFAAGTAMHSWRAVAQGKSSVAKKGMHLAATVLAACGAELLEKPELIKCARKDFDNTVGKRKYRTLIPEDIRPEDF